MQKLTALLFLLSFYYAEGQPLDTINTRLPQPADTVAQDVTLPVFNGRIFYGHLATEGHAFYLSPDWQPGSILYDGTWYTGLTIKYDTYKDELIVQHPSRNAIRLFTERVQQFTLGQHSFIRFVAGSDSTLKTGFYEKLAGGKLTILALRKKNIEEYIEDYQVVRRFVFLDSYYALKDGKYYLITNYKSLLSLIKEHKQTIVKQLKKEGLKFRKNRQATLVKAAEIYNQSAR